MENMNTRDIGNEDITARTGSELLISVLGLNNTTKAIALYTLLITTREPITGLSLDNFSSGNYDINYVKASNGANVCTTMLDEVDPAGEISLNFDEDFTYVHDNSYGFTRSVLLAMLRGETFTMGSDIITVIGMNGTNKTNKSKCRKSEMNLPCKSIVDIEGKFLKITGGVLHGMPTFKRNIAIGAYNVTKKMVAIEIKQLSGQGIQNTRMIPYVSVDTITFDEGDKNSYSLTGTRACDVWERTDFFTEGAEPKTPNEIKVDYISNTKEPTTGKQDELCCVVSANGEISMKKRGASAWEDDTTLKNEVLKESVRIFANKCTLDTGGAKIQTVNSFVVVGVAGTTSTKATASLFSLPEATTKNFICNVYNYNRDVKAFEEYTSLI